MAAHPTGELAQEPPIKPGETFHGLQVVELVGQGGMGVVYKARHPQLDRMVALKILSCHDPEFLERFKREARTLAGLTHPNIVAVHDFGIEGDLPFLVMEYVPGVNLRQVLREGKLSPAQALKIVPQLCDALEYAHDEGVVHRDIKPENILVDTKGRVKIADFGLAKLIGSQASHVTQSNVRMGTPHYMAPEQVEKPADVDHRADIYSMGVVFYEMLTGELPLGRFAPPSRKVQIDVRLDDVVLRALEKEPELRYQRASDVKQDVTRIVEAPALSPNARASQLWSGAVATLLTGAFLAFEAPIWGLSNASFSAGLWLTAGFVLLALSIIASFPVARAARPASGARLVPWIALVGLTAVHVGLFALQAPSNALLITQIIGCFMITLSLVDARRRGLKWYRPLTSWAALALLLGPTAYLAACSYWPSARDLVEGKHRCENSLKQMALAVEVYRNKCHQLPAQTGSAFWAQIAREFGHEPETPLYRGPALDANVKSLHLETDPMACDEAGKHPDGTIHILTYGGSVFEAKPGDPQYQRALDFTAAKHSAELSASLKRDLVELLLTRTKEFEAHYRSWSQAEFNEWASESDYAARLLTKTASWDPEEWETVRHHWKTARGEQQCGNNLNCLSRLLEVYRKNFGGQSYELPRQTGTAFWRKLVDSGIIEKSSGVLTCPLSGKPAGTITYRGPKFNINVRKNYGTYDPFACDNPGNHPDGSIHILTYGCQVIKLNKDDPAYARALELTSDDEPKAPDK